MRCSITLLFMLSLGEANKTITNSIRKRKLSDDKRHLQDTDASIVANPVTPDDFTGQSIGNNILADRRIIRRTKRQRYTKVKIGPITFSEKFEGMERTTPKLTLGLEDNLIGDPKPPLRLSANFDKKQNINVSRRCEKNNSFKSGQTCYLMVMGTGPANYEGFGSFAGLLKKNASQIQMKFFSKHTAKAVVNFFDCNASKLGELQVDLFTADTYRFSEINGKNNICGFSVHPKGDNGVWHKLMLTALELNTA